MNFLAEYTQNIYVSQYNFKYRILNILFTNNANNSRTRIIILFLIKQRANFKTIKKRDTGEIQCIEKSR
jgi:hypothetical protein